LNSSRALRRYFGIHIDLHATLADTELGARVTPSLVNALLDAGRPDYIQYDCKGHPGVLAYPGSQVSVSAPGIVNDSLAIYRAETAKRGVALLVHYSGVADVTAMHDHPEWAAVDANGAALGHVASLFGPYLRERMIPHLLEIIGRYDVDGFWIDGDCWSVKPDHHPEAVRRFREKVGDAPVPTGPNDPHWLAWGDVHRQAFLEYVHQYTAAVRAHRPGVRVTSNYLFSPHAPVAESSVPIDFRSGDLAPNNSVDAVRLNGRYLNAVEGPWDLMSWSFTRAKNKHAPWQATTKPAAQLCQEAAGVLALGGGFQLFMHPDRHGGFEGWQIQLLRTVADFVHDRAAVCAQPTTTVPQVALWLDEQDYFSRAHRLMAPWSGEFAALEGTMHALLRTGHDVSLRATHHLQTSAQQWPLIVVPEVLTISAERVDWLKRYAERGGSVLLIGASACRAMADELGVRAAGEDVVADQNVYAIALAEDQMPARVFGAWLPVEVIDAEVLAERTRSAMRDDVPMPAVVMRSLGKGRIAGVLGAAGSSFYRAHYPPLARLLDGVARRLYEPMVELSARPGVEIDLSIRQRGDELIVHLVNVSGRATASNCDSERYHFVESVPASGPVRVTVRVKQAVRSVTLEPGSIQPAVTRLPGHVVIDVPEVGTHTAVVIRCN
jgi:hypothetical protein